MTSLSLTAKEADFSPWATQLSQLKRVTQFAIAPGDDQVATLLGINVFRYDNITQHTSRLPEPAEDIIL